MKALKKICTALMLLAFAFVFASCSSGSDSDDDDSSTKVLPPSVGENVLAGNSYQYSKKYDKGTVTTTYEFKDDTVTEKTVESSETEITEYKYTYNANTGLLYLKVVSWTRGGVKMTSMNDVYKCYAKVKGGTVEQAKEYFGDADMFAGNISKCYFVKDDGNILLGDYFGDDKDVEGSEFVYAENVALRADFDGKKIKLNGDTEASWKIELDAKAKTFSGKEIEGSYTVKEKATKTLKDLNGYDKSNEANGYITINFANLPATLKSEPYNMKTGTEYKFIFDPDCDEYKKL